MRVATVLALCCVASNSLLWAQQPPYDNPPPAEPPYYRVRYEASTESGALVYPVTYTVWIPPGVATLRGVIVHQHGCGEGSCKSGQTGAFDLHWQALARKHQCALMAPSYEQPEGADCQKWCDPRNGSDLAFQQALIDLAQQSGHLELATIPWALWGHSGGGHWAGGMLLLHPDRVAAVWLRSGVPALQPVEGRPIQPHQLAEGALRVPVMCNLGTKEGVTAKDGRFAGVWPANEAFFTAMRSRGALIAVAVDPLTSHECGNQRYLAIPWFDACLATRLPDEFGLPLKTISEDDGWLAPLHTGQSSVVEPVAAVRFAGRVERSVWLPNAAVARAWTQYVQDTAIPDTTPPPAPTNVRLQGNELTWEAEADMESGLAQFVILRDGQPLATLPETPTNRFGRPVFQGLQYSDTPAAPLIEMRYRITGADLGSVRQYQVRAVNTVGLTSE